MKKLIILLLLAVLILFPSCDSDSSSSEADAETQAAVEAVAGEAIMISYMGMIESMMASGVSPGIARPTTSGMDITGYPGAVLSGSFEIDGDVFTADFTITFTDYTNTAESMTINGTIDLDITGNSSEGSYTLSITGDLSAVYEGSSYDMDFNLTVSTTATEITASGYVECNGYRVEYSYTESIPS